MPRPRKPTAEAGSAARITDPISDPAATFPLSEGSPPVGGDEDNK